MKWILFLLPWFYAHEGGHQLAALFCRRQLKFFYQEGSLWGVPVPRYCWYMPDGLSLAQRRMIWRAGFRTEFACSLLFAWSLPLAGLYLAGAVIHYTLYRSYGGNPEELDILG